MHKIKYYYISDLTPDNHQNVEDQELVSDDHPSVEDQKLVLEDLQGTQKMVLDFPLGNFHQYQELDFVG